MRYTLPLIALIASAVPAQNTSSCASSASHESRDIVAVANEAGAFKTLLTAAKAAGLVDALKSEGPLTVFAPTDAAFDKLPKGTVAKLLKNPKKLAAILKYHVVPGRVAAKQLVKKDFVTTLNGQSFRVMTSKKSVGIDGAKVVKTDIEASNGLIHVIDSVILPRKTIVETAVSAGQFKTLVAAVKAAGLAEALSAQGPFTVFAPSDDAFAKLPKGTVAKLLKNPKKLAAILKYHVIPGRVLASDIPMLAKKAKLSASPATLQGQKLSIRKTGKGVSVDGAKVVAADIICGNGVIHVIDSVVLPR